MTSRHDRSALTPAAFDSLLFAFDKDRERAGEKYELVRRRLLKFFECRGSAIPEDDADETITRVANRLHGGELIENLGAYFYGVARFVLLESGRERRREVSQVELARDQPPTDAGAEEDTRLGCVEHCLARLPARGRELLLSYYQSDPAGRIRDRHELAKRHGIAANALRIRVHRLRATVESCARRCLEESTG